MRRLRRTWSPSLASLALLGVVLTAACAEEPIPSPPPVETSPASAESPITEVDQSKVKRQTIGNCWLYATMGWVESMHRTASNEELDLSESYLTYVHWFEQIVRGEATTIETGGDWSFAAGLIERYGVILEADFIPEEVGAESSARQKAALEAITESLQRGVLSEAAKRTDPRVVRAELDRAWGLTPQTVKMLDDAFGKGINRTLTSSPAAKTLGAIKRPSDISVAARDPQNTSNEITLTLQDVIGEGFRYRSGQFAWQEVSFPKSAPARRAYYQRIQRALHDGQPVILSWLVEFNALTPKGVFSKAELDDRGPGRQGGHMTILSDYEATFVPGYGTLSAGVPATDAQKQAALADEVRIPFFRVKNSWGTYREDRAAESQLEGYYDLETTYLEGPISYCAQVGGTSDPAQCEDMIPLWDVILPPGY